MGRVTDNGQMKIARCVLLALLLGMLSGCLTPCWEDPPEGVVGPAESDAVAWKHYTDHRRSVEPEPPGTVLAEAIVSIGNAIARKQ